MMRGKIELICFVSTQVIPDVTPGPHTETMQLITGSPLLHFCPTKLDLILIHTKNSNLKHMVHVFTN